MPWVSWSFFWMLRQVCEANWKPGLAGHNLLTLETGDWKGRCEVWTSNPRQSLTVGSWPWWTQYALLRRPNWEPESDTCRNRGQLPQTPPNWELESTHARMEADYPKHHQTENIYIWLHLFASKIERVVSFIVTLSFSGKDHQCNVRWKSLLIGNKLKFECHWHNEMSKIFVNDYNIKTVVTTANNNIKTK